MKLTGEQERVVNLSKGRHLVLAPPGSGKTEMLSRRILRALKSGVKPSRMLCATFTNRAAFEMRERLAGSSGNCGDACGSSGAPLPDVGNIHHFCHSFLRSVGRLGRDVHVLDEVEQSGFVEEVVKVLHSELKNCAVADMRRFHGVTVIRGVKKIVGPSPDSPERPSGELNESRVRHVFGVFEVFADVALNAGSARLYGEFELASGLSRSEGEPMSYSALVAKARCRIEKFLRYADHVYGADERPFGKVLEEDWEKIRKLKEADLLVGDEKIVISTVHKAKGRQFDAVLIPDAEDILSARGGDCGERRRLLYVAMSRARRHLSVWGGGAEELRSVRKCFARGYENYYAKKARGALGPGDWLSDWEFLAESNNRRECPEKEVFRLLSSEADPVARMAHKTLRWHGEAREKYIEALRDFRRPFLFPVVMSCLSDCGMFDAEVADLVRSAALGGIDEATSLAAIGYFVRASAEDRDRAVRAVGDFVYSRYPLVRESAAAFLSDCGIERWRGVVSGAGKDFERIAGVEDAEHEETVRAILRRRDLPGYYERSLRRILSQRSKKESP